MTKKTYSKYKPSDINWIGEIPEGWEVRKLKFYSFVYTGNSISDSDKEQFDTSDEGYPYISTKDINVNTSKINYQNGMVIPFDNENFKIACKNSTLLCVEGGSAGKKIGYINKDVAFVNKLCCFKPENINSKFQYYYIKSLAFKEEFNLNLTGLIGGVSKNILKNIKIIYPPLTEQQPIANFLDDKTTKIDEAISLKKKQIELLKEKRVAMINQAVTKGLDPHVKMIDSGIEWIGEIPKEWEVNKVKYLNMMKDIQFQDGNHGELHPKSSDYVDEGIPFVMASDVRNGRIDFDDCKKITKERADKLRIGFSLEGDVLFTHKGTIGEVAVIGKINTPYLMLTPQVTYYRIKSKEIFNKYLGYYFESHIFKSQLDYICSIQSTRDYIGLIAQKNLFWIIPGLEEQQTIADYLGRETELIDGIITSIEHSIDLLVEYKQSLISHVVTGKVKVF